MKLFKYHLAILCSLCLYVPALAQPSGNALAKATALCKTMTLKEKVGQMAQVTLDVLGSRKNDIFYLDEVKLKDAIQSYALGSVLNTSDNTAMSTTEWNRIIGELQQASAKTRLKIPLIYGIDAIHGSTYVAGATFFPQQIGQAASWNRKLVFDASSITAYETHAASIPWNFAPVLDLGVNPLWPRLWETFGEDPYLVSEMGLQAINGYQYPLNSKQKVAACLKHFLAYGDPKSGKDRTNAWIPEHYLREYHLPAFEAAIRAGARSVMVNSALINGVPVHANKKLLTGLLKSELGFSGIVVTDWQDIENIFKRDKIASSHKEALMMAINAGIDMAMIPYDYKTFCDDLVSLVNEKKVSVNRINDAVTRILRVKYELDLFNTPVTSSGNYPEFGSAANERTAYLAAAESMTLLKNSNDMLPLPSSAKVLVTGPNANSMRTLNGGWSYSWQGEKTDKFSGNYLSILAAMKKKLGANQVLFQEGVAYKMQGKYYEDSLVDIKAVIQAADAVDYIILCLGENSYTEKPGDLNDLNLSDNQQLLAQAVIKTGKPVILILNEGRPRIISHIEPDISAILMAYLPGNFGGIAIADVLLGDVNPSGKLPITYPRYVNALTNYIHKPSDEQSNPQGAYDYSADYNPQYNFGFGLSYTSFLYSNLNVNKTSFTADDTLRISVTVKNTGKRDGMEVVQVYSSDLVASLSPDIKRLRGFEKILIKAGEEKKLSFNIPVKNLGFVHSNNKWVIEKGDFMIRINNLEQKIFVASDKQWP